MQQEIGNLQDVFTELNIKLPIEEESQECVLTQWKDITSFLEEATADLDVGQLVHLQSFTLFDAMSAIEIMNPRMDTGMLVKQTFQEFDITRKLSAKQTLNIMDNLVPREMAWISGHSLSQTVYTCIYLSHIRSLNEIPIPTKDSSVEDIIYGALRSYILATAKSCYYVFTEMTNGNVYEEEDFTTNLFGLTFDDQNPDFMVLNDIDASIELIHHALTMDVPDKNVLQEILSRMEIRKSYLLSLVYLSQTEASYMSQAKTELNKIVELLSEINLTVSEEFIEAFDPNINRKLTSQTPPRPVELESVTESFKQYGSLIKRLLSICDAGNYPSITSLMNYFLYFGAQQPYADAFSRSKLNTLFSHNGRIFGKLSISQMMLESIKEMVQPPLWWTTPDVKSTPSSVNPVEFMQAHDTLKAYLERVSLVFIEYFKINCHNRSRQRRMLCKILSEWEILQEEAAGVDEVFHNLLKDQEGNPIDTPYYFSSWAYNLKLTMIEKTLFLGFELDLYGTHEYIMVYWYIQCVLGSRAYLLERIAGYVDPSLSSTEVDNYLHTSQFLNHAKKCLSEAMLKILVTAKHLGQFDLQIHDFDDEETRYGHRFKPFVNLLSPPHPPYSTFLEMLDVAELDVTQMKQVIKRDLTGAKKTLEEVVASGAKETNSEMFHDGFIEEHKNLIRTTVANTIGLNYISDKSTPIETNFKYHPWFPIIMKK